MIAGVGADVGVGEESGSMTYRVCLDLHKHTQLHTQYKVMDLA